jgi:hypothetical protein
VLGQKLCIPQETRSIGDYRISSVWFHAAISQHISSLATRNLLSATAFHALFRDFRISNRASPRLCTGPRIGQRTLTWHVAYRIAQNKTRSAQYQISSSGVVARFPRRRPFPKDPDAPCGGIAIRRSSSSEGHCLGKVPPAHRVGWRQAVLPLLLRPYQYGPSTEVEPWVKQSAAAPPRQRPRPISGTAATPAGTRSIGLTWRCRFA